MTPAQAKRTIFWQDAGRVHPDTLNWWEQFWEEPHLVLFGATTGLPMRMPQ